MTSTNALQLNTPASASFSVEEILSTLFENGMVDADGVQLIMKKKQKETLLSHHNHKIWEGDDGRWRTFLPDANKPKGRRLVSRGSKEALEEMLCSYYASADADTKKDSLSLKDIYDEWIEYKSLHVVSSTVIRIGKDWNKYYVDSEIASKPISSITKLELDTWIHQMIREHKMTKHKYGNFSLIIRQMMDYAVDRGIISANPLLNIRIDKKRVLTPEHKKADHTQVFTREEKALMIKHARAAFDRHENYVQQLVPLAVEFMFYTGLRVSEVSAIRYEDLDGITLKVRRILRYPAGEVIDSTKGTFGDRDVLLIPAALDVIEKVTERRKALGLGTDGYIFCPNDRPLNTYTSIQKTFTKYCRELGIENKSAHKARKTTVSSMIDSGININTVRQFVGHMDEKTTLNNYCYDRSTDPEKYAQVISALS